VAEAAQAARRPPGPGSSARRSSPSCRSFLSAFRFTEDGGIASCPAGKAPIRDEAVGVNLFRATKAWRVKPGGNPTGKDPFDRALPVRIRLHTTFWLVVRARVMKSDTASPKLHLAAA
jgi:hypothetical protein